MGAWVGSGTRCIHVQFCEINLLIDTTTENLVMKCIYHVLDIHQELKLIWF